MRNISIILVQPQHSGNVGAAARAMKNMGLTRLKLVDPRRPVNEECRRMAGRAADLAEAAEVHSDFETAVAEESVLVATTSTRSRTPRRTTLNAREAAALIVQWARSRRVGLVFGPERSGLTDAQLARCQALASVPANPDYPVLNLAQAVLLMGYEIRTAGVPVLDEPAAAAPQRLRQQMFRQMQEVLIQIGFLSAGNPEGVMDSLRVIMDRPDLTAREVRIVRGIFSHMEWYVREGWRLGPKGVRKP